MEFVIDKNILLSGLSKIQGLIDRRTPHEILNNILIKTVENGIEITGTDIEISFRGIFDSNVVEEGSITIPGKKIYEVVREFPDSEVYVKSIENFWVEIRCQNSFFKLGGVDPDNYPLLPEIGDIDFITINAKDLKELIDAISFTIGEEGETYGVHGVLIEFNESNPDKIRFVTTDGNRLSYMEKDYKGSIPVNKQIIISRKGGMEVKKLCDNNEDDIEIGFKENLAIFRNRGNTYMMTLLNKAFPDYRKVIPESFNLVVKLEREEFLKSLKRLAPISDTMTNKLFLTIGESRITMETQHQEGEGMDEIEAEVEGEGMTMAMNIKYLMEIVNNIKDGIIIMNIYQKERPVLIRSPGRDDYMYIIMPMRIDSD